MIWIDPVYFWFVLIPVLVISIGVQIYLKRTYAKWSKIRTALTSLAYKLAKSCSTALPCRRCHWRGSGVT